MDKGKGVQSKLKLGMGRLTVNWNPSSILGRGGHKSQNPGKSCGEGTGGCKNAMAVGTINSVTAAPWGRV